MLILLPPSEGTAEPRRGKPVDLAALSLPELASAREQVAAALVTLCGGDADLARTVLGLGPAQSDDVRRNAGLHRAPTASAAKIYTGVLYEALDFATLSPAARRLAQRSVLVTSGLWGVVGLNDRIPWYRCSAGVRLPGVGAVTAYWRSALGAALAQRAAGQVVLDLRSAAYAAMWAPPEALAARTITVRILQERLVDGVPARSIVSHFNKATKGRLVRDLMEGGVRARSPKALVEAVRQLGYRVETPTATAVDVIVGD